MKSCSCLKRKKNAGADRRRRKRRVRRGRKRVRKKCWSSSTAVGRNAERYQCETLGVARKMRSFELFYEAALETAHGARARIADPGKSTRSVNDAEAIKQRASRKASKVAVRVGKQDEDGYGECGEMKTHALTPHALQAEVADKSPPLDQSGKIWALEASRVESVGRVERQE